MSEQALVIDGRMIGIFTPANADAVDRHIIALIPNTGVEHRVGPSRLHVRMARFLSGRGIGTLRLDLNGMGDSLNLKSNPVLDLQAAMDHLQRLTRVDKFMLIGLCSGANDCHRTARKDPRVVAAVFLDGYTYPTPHFKSLYFSQRVLSPARWLNLFRKPASVAAREKINVKQAAYYEQPDTVAVTADYESFVQRKMALLFVFTGQFQNVYNYREQIIDGFPALRKDAYLGLYYFNRADHTFTREQSREQLFFAMDEWIAQHPRFNTSQA